jgi:hypothetical protein
MVRLSLRALSVYGKKIASSLRASEPELNQHCSCPPGESCSVEITELPGRRFEAVVIRPGTVAEPQDWSEITAVFGTYRRVFDKRATAQRIREGVAFLVGATLNGRKTEASAEPLPSAADLNIVLVDSESLRQARKLIFGCQFCSPYAEIPFDSILDRVTGHDPAVTQYILAEGSMNCPRCRRQVSESTLVEFEPPPENSDFLD